MVYDITNRNSFQSVKSLLKTVKSNSDKDAIICVAANKMDLQYVENANVNITEGEKWAKVSIFGDE